MEREDRTKRDSLEDGTELVDVFKILSDLPKERLQSLTLKLQTLEGNGIAKYLCERVNIWGETLNNFRMDRTAMAEDSLIDLARIFKLLAEERLCEIFLRDCAYKRALKACERMARTYKEGQKYQQLGQLKKEARKVCGSWIEDVIQDTFSFTNLPSGEYCSSFYESNTALKHSLSNQSLPSSLQTYISQGLPSHLEISVSEDKRLSELSPYQVKLPAAHCFDNTEKDALVYNGKSQVTDGPLPIYKVNSSTSPHMPSSLAQKGSPSIKTQTNPNTFLKCKTHAEEEESVFYSFVILHAEEDIDLAERLKEKLEALNIGCGATSSHFAIPGKSTLTCIEDAIDNSAFTLLLLTSNFNTRLLEIETNSALMNSINNKHKYNTVIPLHPKENCMLKERMPKILQILVPLKENEMFEKKAKKAINPVNIEYQRQVWKKEQRVKE
uniref:TRIF n=1 Tax=Plecoglossus altivelis TaxID=61084 RepID=A0A5J6NEL5_PLEAT|nr:TRIF [Plecoglossus altivelis]